MREYYCSYVETELMFDRDEGVFDVAFEGKVWLSDCHFLKDGERVKFEALKNYSSLDASGMNIMTETGEILITLRSGRFFINSSEPVSFIASPAEGDYIATSRGEHKFFRASFGNGANALDDMLFERSDDFGIALDCSGKKLFYDYKASLWQIRCTISDINERVQVSFEKDVYKNRWGIDYSPLNRNTTFSSPPVGWMTWYAVKFDACEKAVLDNARWLADNLKKFGANSIWVDWEWYHRDMKGVRDDGCDCFHPDPQKYPNGLKYVSDKIRELGLVPCLWMGVSTDPGENDFVKEHPEAVLVHTPVWCGQYFFDFTHPEYLNNYLPRILSQVDEWGYEAVKMDTLPNGVVFNEEKRLKSYDPSKTTRQAFREVIRKSREILGENRYMLSCSGINDAVILWPCDMCEAVRIGDDIFAWESFVAQAVGRAARYYPFHSIVFYNDADNVIVREEFNTFEQAKSRCAFVSLLGLPVTLGDNLPDLPEERVELLRRSIPALDIHSSSLFRFVPETVVTTCLSVENDFDSYYLVSLFNTGAERVSVETELSSLGIEFKNPLVFEYYSSEFEKTQKLSRTLAPYETAVFAVREDKGRPQILSTSRHITQGALEIKDMSFVDGELSFVAELVENDPYTVTLHLPENYVLKDAVGFDKIDASGELARFEVKPDSCGDKEFKIIFGKDS